MYVEAKTLDDLMRKVLSKLLKCRDKIRPTKGDAVELRGALIHLSNPRARLSNTETKGIIFSCLGEFLWYMSGRDDLSMIQYYISRYSAFSEADGTINGAYGPRMFNMRGVDQFSNVTQLLKRDDSRQAVIQLFNAEDIATKYKDTPCTCTMQFFRRGGKLDMFVSMRSNDAFVGMPHDIFCFTMMQEMLAVASSLQVGAYSHAVGSLHLYDVDRDKAQAYLHEGWRTPFEMPAMPPGDPWPSLRSLIDVEDKLRRGDSLATAQLPPFWSDLADLLRIYALTRGSRHLPIGDLRKVAQIKQGMSSQVYANYIRRRVLRLEAAASAQLELV